MPIEGLPAAAPVFRPNCKKAGTFLLTVESAFRRLATPVLGDLREDAYHLDLRCLEATGEARFAVQWSQLKC